MMELWGVCFSPPSSIAAVRLTVVSIRDLVEPAHLPQVIDFPAICKGEKGQTFYYHKKVFSCFVLYLCFL